MTIIKLILMPIVGIVWVKKLIELNWILMNGDEKVLAFVIIIGFGLPSFTAQVYLTALYAQKTEKNQIIESRNIDKIMKETTNSQMECLAVCLLVEYPILFISMPFIVTYILKTILML